MKAAVQFDFHDKITDAASRIAASTIFQLIATTLLVEAAGIWERFDPAGFSIPTICTTLDHPSVLQALRDGAGLPPPNGKGVIIPSAEERAVVIDSLPDSFKEIDKKIEKDSALQKIRNYRNKYAAHPILATREERSKKTSLEHPTFGEVKELLSSAASVLRKLQTAALGYTYDYSELQEQSMVAPYRFYSGLSYSAELSDRILSETPTQKSIPPGTRLRDL